MSQTSNSATAVVGIDIGKNSFELRGSNRVCERVARRLESRAVDFFSELAAGTAFFIISRAAAICGPRLAAL